MGAELGSLFDSAVPLIRDLASNPVLRPLDPRACRQAFAPLVSVRSQARLVVVAACSPPDRHGYVSLGTNSDYVAPFIGKVPFFLEANARMPRTMGRNHIHLSQVAGWCEVDRPLVEVPPAEPNELDARMDTSSGVLLYSEAILIEEEPSLDELLWTIAAARLILPAKFRPQLASGLVVTRGQERCLFVFPVDDLPVAQAGASARVARAEARKRTMDILDQGRDFLRRDRVI